MKPGLEALSKLNKKMAIPKIFIRQGVKTTLLNISKIRYILASGYYAEIFTKKNM